MATAQVVTRAGRYLTFQLSRQYFAIRSEYVRHIVPGTDIRLAPKRFPFLYGWVANNGRLIPVIDIREQLGLPQRAMRANACVLVVGPDAGCPVQSVGLIVDKLSEVVDFRVAEVRGNTAQQRIQGRPYGRPKTVLEPAELLEPEQWANVRSAIL